ncbi:hypothetical protein Taro_036405 [Colocasia esculenta]|uniref:Uncharacterized protein n=1 Tax=Colocasia esculenta TaxID=4460 RepID=A0A843W9N5_COLES|nr:hypothetical protein [Colocasia esculenta]
MAGLLAWAADVVGGGHGAEDDEEAQFPALVFTPEQEERARGLDQRATSLRRSIQELRRRIPPADISQRLPHLHAHSLASSAALALQQNAHSTTRQQTQIREETLQEENTAYEKAILACHKKIQEKAQEASLLQSKLEEIDLTEKDVRAELDKAQANWKDNQRRVSLDDSRDTEKVHPNEKPSKSVVLEQLNEKKNELSTYEVMVHSLEEKWAAAQHDSLTHPPPESGRVAGSAPADPDPESGQSRPESGRVGLSRDSELCKPVLWVGRCSPQESGRQGPTRLRVGRLRSESADFAIHATYPSQDKWEEADIKFSSCAAQREKTLEKQLHSLIEQLTVKQAQAEGLISEIKVKEQELEKLNSLRRRLELGSVEENAARNRFGRSSRIETAYADQTTGTHHRHFNGVSRAENQQKLILLRSAFVLYILALHVLVFIKLSF